MHRGGRVGRGQAAGLKEPNISPARIALWKFRTEHALARLAARRNQPEIARKHVAAARAALDSNAEMAKDQEIFFPYLTGYVALYSGDAKTALGELQKARQDDPFIQYLMAQAHEKLGETEQAMALFRKAASTTAHNPPAAFARPFAMKKIARPSRDSVSDRLQTIVRSSVNVWRTMRDRPRPARSDLHHDESDRTLRSKPQADSRVGLEALLASRLWRDERQRHRRRRIVIEGERLSSLRRQRSDLPRAARPIFPGALAT